MTVRLALAALAVLGLAGCGAGAAAPAIAAGGLPVTFERNAGQAAPGVHFVARATGGALLLTRSGDAILAPAGGGALRLHLAGADPRARGRGIRRARWRTHYLLGAWRRDVAGYAEVRYRGVYPGVDLRWHGIEYDFELAPGADPGAIAIDVRGARRLRIDAGGDLRATVGGRTVVQRAPLIRQNGRALRGRFVLRGPRRVGFALGAHDRARPLVIDPSIAFDRTLGGSGSDAGRAVAVDRAGNTYVAGETSSPDLPTAGRGRRRAPGGTRQAAFVAKLDARGRLVYTTILGGSRFTAVRGIAVDRGGHAYVTGATNSTDFPTTRAALQPSYGGGPFDAFVTALSADGGHLRYSTFVGDTHYDEGNAIAVDRGGRAAITGKTASPQFPRAGGLRPPVDGGAFVSKLDRTGARLVFSGVFGGDDRANHGNTGFGIASDPAGRTYVAGVTNAPTFPTLRPLQGSVAGGGDAFVVKIDAAGHALYSTYLGGGAEDAAHAIAADAAGNAYVTGVTSSPDFPWRGRQPSAGGAADAFAAKLDPGGRTLAYAARLGGSGGEEGAAIAVDAGGRAYVTGRTGSADFPLVAPVGTTGGAFVSVLGPAGAPLRLSTRLGRPADDGLGIAVGPAGAIAVTGQAATARGGDAFVRVLRP